MDNSFRRVVTVRDNAGTSVVVSDGASPQFAKSGTRLVRQWATDAAPARILRPDDSDAIAIGLVPPPGGTRFLFFEVGPEDETLSSEDLERVVADNFERMGATEARVDTRRDPRMHLTHTIDYIIVLSGEITLLLDHGDVTLTPFDVVIQQATNHAWVNRSDEPALLAVVMIDGAVE